MSEPTRSNGFRTSVTATLSVRDWTGAIEFYKAAFGATELYRVDGGGVAQLAVSGAEFWVAEESPQHFNFSPESGRMFGPYAADRGRPSRCVRAGGRGRRNADRARG
jgi:catechol 2,3-dioxygenase-like lactoylglutathione lyase family enzyme